MKKEMIITLGIAVSTSIFGLCVIAHNKKSIPNVKNKYSDLSDCARREVVRDFCGMFKEISETSCNGKVVFELPSTIIKNSSSPEEARAKMNMVADTLLNNATTVDLVDMTLKSTVVANDILAAHICEQLRDIL